MSDAVMRKSYTVVCVRSTGQLMELETVGNYMTALNSAKNALTNKHNTEVRVVESNYDQATRKDKKQVVKILTAESNAPSAGHAKPASTAKKPAVSREVANRASKSVINIVIALVVLLILGGIIVPMVVR